MGRHLLLTDRGVKNAKPDAKAYRLADGGNLYLCVPRSGASAWQFRYRLHAKPQTAPLGSWSTGHLPRRARLPRARAGWPPRALA